MLFWNEHCIIENMVTYITSPKMYGATWPFCISVFLVFFKMSLVQIGYFVFMYIMFCGEACCSVLVLCNFLWACLDSVLCPISLLLYIHCLFRIVSFILNSKVQYLTEWKIINNINLLKLLGYVYYTCPSKLYVNMY